MLDKEFDDLSMKEKYTLQKIMKKQRDGDVLSQDEHLLYEKHKDRWASEESKTKGKWPIIIGLIVMSLFAVIRSCQ